MKTPRYSSALLAALVMILVSGAFFLAAPHPGTQTAHASVDDFTFESWDVSMEVRVDETKMSHAKVTETITAIFPTEFDQNKGIVRGVPESYRDFPLEVKNVKVTDENGQEYPFSTESGGGELMISTGDDDYVRGKQTYVISYELTNVVQHFETNGKQIAELYWNLVPFERTQEIEAFTATVTFDDSLTPKLLDEHSCYIGETGYTATCDIARDAGAFTVGPFSLPAVNGVTVAVGFEPDAVRESDWAPFAKVLRQVPLISAILAAVLGLVAGIGKAVIVRRDKRRYRTGIVVPQYEVPDSMPPMVANTVLRGRKNPFSANIIHLAVNGVIRLEEKDSRWGRKPLVIRKGERRPSTLDGISHQVFNAILYDKNEFEVKRSSNSERVHKWVNAVSESAVATAERAGLFSRVESSKWLRSFSTVSVLLSTVGTIAPQFFPGVPSSALPWFAWMIIFFSVNTWGKHKRFTPEGAAVAEHLEGVKMFLKVAEEERLRVLQSHEGAERIRRGEVNVVHLYEKLLPFAMLYGMERSWTKNLEKIYASTGSTPATWYTGSPGDLSTALNSFSRGMASASGTSATGGSAGGGFAGGGGGGGSAGGR